MNMSKMDNVKVDDLEMRPDVFALCLQRRARLEGLHQRRDARN